MWQFVGNRPVYCLMISDVPGDNPADIGSGVLFPVDGPNGDELPELPEEFSKKIPGFIQRKQAKGFVWKIIASLDVAKDAAAAKAKELGYSVDVQSNFLTEKHQKLLEMC